MTTKDDQPSSKKNNKKKEIVPINPEEKGDDILPSANNENSSSEENEPHQEKLTKMEKRLRKGLIPNKLPQKLQQIRRHLNVSQSQLLPLINPFETGENRARVSQWERGIRTPTVIEIWNYAKLAKVPMEILVDDDAELPF